MDKDNRAASSPGAPVFDRPGVLMSVYLPPVFFGALLMFWSELLIGKMVLPLLGGTPMVWTACVVFFQSLLLAGYVGAHWSLRLGPGVRAMLYLAVIAASLPFLPIGADAARPPPADADPRPWLIGWLTAAVGAPFLVLAAAGPLLQAWFARTRHPRAADPYFLYVASNAGSLIGLLAFPVLAEPQWSLSQQSALWSRAYGAFAALLVVAALVASRGAPSAVAAERPVAAAPPVRDRLRWVALAFAPSSLFLGLTSLITTDIAAVPLIWMLPLAAYLITFMIAFARRPPVPHWMASKVHPVAVLPALFFWFWDIGVANFMMIGLLFAAFFATALVCHGELARTRPAASRLTDFYLCLSFGGMLGGIFNLLVAPLVFDRVFEYPLVLVLALLLRPAADSPAADGRRLDLLIPAGWLAAMLAALLLYRAEIIPRESEVIGTLSVLMGMFIVLSQSRRLRFGLIAAGLLIANQVVPLDRGDVIYASRNFFGVSRVIEDRPAKVRLLYNGTTQHGAQHTDQRRLLPVSYYAADGPLGQAFALPEIDRADAVVAAIGLGAGAAACHARKGQRVTFYEIDPAVKRIATDPALFTFLRDCPAKSEVVLGDGRILLARAPAASLDLIVLDAFSSDAIPVHLLTREALALYRSRLKPGGLLLAHTSNRYLDLTQVLAPLARDAGLSAFVRTYEPPPDSVSEAVSNAQWVLLAPAGSPAARSVGSDPTWDPLEAGPDAPVWTDSFSSLLGILR
jgi:hypothetical protein